ncbi:MAG: ferrous iron transporter B [Candidatus Zixiibacteriota bacterium]|nr:MAG: ferrous iron transporter B [candidate division Zixibacteria bacterium]
MFLPQIVILFFFISVLEDSGYLPRAAFLVDRMFSWCGLSGRSLIPLLTSFACAVPGIMSTRTIENRRVRFMTILVAPLMSCSARLPVYTILIAAFIPHTSILGLFNLQGLVLAAMYLIGILVAVVIAFLLKKTTKRPTIGSFLMELPPYRVPTAQVVGIRVWTRARMFLVRAGTIILAITIIIWALSYYPQAESAATADDTTVTLQGTGNVPSAAQQEELQAGAQLRNSYLGQAGRALEPVFKPLGWDWKITMAALASFPAREVIISTLGTIYNLGRNQDETSVSLIEKMREARWDHGPKLGQPVFSPAVALSIMVFFALCAQCAATLVTIRQETGNWKYSVFTFVYMTTLAYLGGALTYQVLSRLGW